MPITVTLFTDTGVSRTKTFTDAATAEEFLFDSMGLSTSHGLIVEGVSRDSETGEETYTEY
jgi:hypothetical protein